jgi:hypothetical protein
MANTKISSEIEISFGDRVRLRQSPETEAAGIAGHVAEVRGITTPSVTGIQPIGGVVGDCAYNVFIEELNRDEWLGATLLEFVDHGPGTTITLDGVPKTWTRAESGEWQESSRRLPVREWWSWFRGIGRRSSRR